MSRSDLFGIVTCLGAVACLAGTAFAQQTQDPLERPLELPRIGPGESCPTSTGSRDTIPRQRHIFGVGGLWFGAGPVHFSLAWKSSSDRYATFALEPVPFESGAYRAKTPWVSTPSYAGAVLIRGHAIDGSTRTLGFDATGAGPRERLELRAPNAPAESLWSFWPSAIWIPAPGCYGVQIDTTEGTDVVIFEATLERTDISE